MAMAPTAKGWAPFGEYRTWYRVTGTIGGRRPVVVAVHGGPGGTHDNLLGLCSLVEDGWPVVHYDQIGSGSSSALPDRDAGFWTPELFGAQLNSLLDHLGIADNHVLYGHSWGGLVAARHAANRPAGLRGLVVANAAASYPLLRTGIDTLRAQLPPQVEAALRAHEAAGTTNSPDYADALRVFGDRHLCRIVPWPEDQLAAHLELLDNDVVHSIMFGPSPISVTGTIRDYSVIDHLVDIDVPTLVITGRHDIVTPDAVAPFAELVPDVRLEIFADSGHVPHLEEPVRFRRMMVDFLGECWAREREVAGYG